MEAVTRTKVDGGGDGAVTRKEAATQTEAATRMEARTTTEAATWMEAQTKEVMTTEVVTRTEVVTWTEMPRWKVGAETQGHPGSPPPPTPTTSYGSRASHPLILGRTPLVRTCGCGEDKLLVGLGFWAARLSSEFLVVRAPRAHSLRLHQPISKICIFCIG
jgi:hypothetical protein